MLNTHTFTRTEFQNDYLQRSLCLLVIVVTFFSSFSCDDRFLILVLYLERLLTAATLISYWMTPFQISRLLSISNRMIGVRLIEEKKLERKLSWRSLSYHSDIYLDLSWWSIGYLAEIVTLNLRKTKPVWYVDCKWFWIMLRTTLLALLA
jgi:hypothetical protein